MYILYMEKLIDMSYSYRNSPNGRHPPLGANKHSSCMGFIDNSIKLTGMC
jgi:hypothetical protein